ncbi:MAG: HIT domain-containing protein [Nevskia sp.]|nr:HIT domain-containing protein [Nevskia sp.]
MRFAKVLACVFLFAAGFACGAAVFVRTQARPLPPLRQCESADACLSDAQVLGLLASVGLRVAPGLMPDIVGRSRECVGIRSPKPEARVDLVFFPRRDIRNLLDVTPADQAVVFGCIALMRDVAEHEGLTRWKIVTNGPGVQEIAYLHFHLMVE